jgi:hypothetical protein
MNKKTAAKLALINDYRLINRKFEYYFIICPKMKKSVIFIILIIIGCSIYAQKDFTAAWYQITPGAQAAIIQGNSNDLPDSNSWDTKTYKEGEILLAFAFVNDLYYCFDPEGRMVKVKGKTGLRKIQGAGQPGYIENDYRVNDKVTLHGPRTVWISAIDMQSKRAMILLNDGTKAGVDVAGLKLYTKWFDFISMGRPFVIAKP